MIVTRHHLFTIPARKGRRGYCRGKSREWFRAHGLDWSSFIRDGIDAARLEETRDALALSLVKWARESEAAKHGQQ